MISSMAPDSFFDVMLGSTKSEGTPEMNGSYILIPIPFYSMREALKSWSLTMGMHIIGVRVEVASVIDPQPQWVTKHLTSGRAKMVSWLTQGRWKMREELISP